MKVDGLDALNRKLAAMPVAAKAEIKKALDKSAAEMEAMATALAPVENGDLRRSVVRSHEGSHELQVIVRAGDENTPAGPVEFGHDQDSPDGGAAPVPFFWPAYRVMKKRHKGRVKRAITRAAKAVARNGS